MIENRITRLDIAQKIDQRNLIGLRTRQRAHDEVEIGCGEPRPTICSNHRDFIMRSSRADGKHLLDPFFCVPALDLRQPHDLRLEKLRLTQPPLQFLVF